MKIKVKMKVKSIAKKLSNWFRYKLKKLTGKDEKIFIIGRNKTGTTSIKECMENMGYIIGDQVTAESFIDDYANRHFDNILKYCDSAEVFQDAPFSHPETYKYIYAKYPNAKYILSERDSSEIWYNSLVRFHRKIIKNGEPINADDLKNFTYHKKDFLWKTQQIVYGIDETTLYDKDIYIKNYECHNQNVKDFFKGKDNFLAINLTDKNIRETLAKFLNTSPDKIKMPHSNRSQ